VSDDVHVTVNVNTDDPPLSVWERPLCGVIFVLFMAFIYGLVDLLLWLVIAAAALLLVAMVVAGLVVNWNIRAIAAQKRRNELIARADRQHQQVCQGDPRGTYGVAWPQRQKYERLTK